MDNCCDAPILPEFPASGATDTAHDLLGQWLGFTEMQGHTLAALEHEIERTSTLVEDSTIDLSRRFQELAESAREQAEHVNRIVAMARFVDIDGDKVPLGELVVSAQKTRSATQNERINAVLETTSSSATDMSATIGRMIMGMQYQDRAKQQLEHVGDSLNVIAAGLLELTDRTRAALPDVVLPPAMDWLDQLLARFTLSDLRERFIRRLMLEGIVVDEPGAAGTLAGGGSGAGDDIELF